jgi:hypothetical protein
LSDFHIHGIYIFEHPFSVAMSDAVEKNATWTDWTAV